MEKHEAMSSLVKKKKKGGEHWDGSSTMQSGWGGNMLLSL